jgi:putative transcriptional regulator
MNRVKEIRIAKGLNQRELAELSHVCQTIISDVERGTRKPWASLITKLARVLKVRKEELFPNDHV